MAEIKDKIVTVESLKAVYDDLNENKAPSGYGLGGESLREVTISELDTLDGNGWYLVDNRQTGIGINNVYFNYALLRTSSTNTGWNVIQELFVLTSDRTKIVRSRKSQEEWYDWECENPPMMEGVEYCTTERWMGKAVYTRLIDVGSMPNNDTKSIRIFDEGTDLTKIRMIDMSGIGISSESGAQQIFPIVTWSQGASVYAQYHSGTGYLSVLARQDMSTYSGIFKLKYTKD